MILIDFVPGSHGNFLETVLNSVELGQCIEAFNYLGASHNKPEPSGGSFVAMHLSFNPEKYHYRMTDFEAIISISLTQHDLPILQSLVLYRAGDSGIDLNDVGKIAQMLDNRTIVESAKEIYENFYDLLSRWDAVDRNSIREMLKLSYNPQTNGIMSRYESISYPDEIPMIDFPFRSFYDRHEFIKALTSTFDKLHMDVDVISCVSEMHERFLERNPFVDLCLLPNKYFDALKNGQDLGMIDMTVYQEAYLDYLYERHYGIEALFYHADGKYFSSTGEIAQYVRSRHGH